MLEVLSIGLCGHGRVLDTIPLNLWRTGAPLILLNAVHDRRDVLPAAPPGSLAWKEEISDTLPVAERRKVGRTTSGASTLLAHSECLFRQQLARDLGSGLVQRVMIA